MYFCSWPTPGLDLEYECEEVLGLVAAAKLDCAGDNCGRPRTPVELYADEAPGRANRSEGGASGPPVADGEGG